MKRFDTIFLFRPSLWDLFLLVAVASLLTACCKDDEPEPVPVDRTVLVYMLSDNSLGYYGYDTQNIKEMLQVAQAGELNGGNLIIYRDGGDTNPQLIQIKRDASGQAQKVIVREYPNRNSATGEVLSAIVDETIELFPASEYGLILWSHSTGWVPGNSSLALSRKRWTGPLTRSFGQDGSNYMGSTNWPGPCPTIGSGSSSPTSALWAASSAPTSCATRPTTT